MKRMTSARVSISSYALVIERFGSWTKFVNAMLEKEGLLMIDENDDVKEQKEAHIDEPWDWDNELFGEWIPDSRVKIKATPEQTRVFLEMLEKCKSFKK